jgi:TorA maturation chaperone TorD
MHDATPDATDAGDQHDPIGDGSTASDGDPDPDDAAFTRSRARVYRLLAAAFDGDVAAFADAIDDGAFAAVAAALPVDVDCGPLDEDPPSEAALAHGYDNLFAVPGPHYVPPFASAHAGDADRREDLRVLQRATLDALGWLDAFDRAVDETDAVEGVFAALATFARTFAAWDARDGIGTTERLR